MKTMMKRLFLILLFCIPACAPWSQGGGPYRSTSHNFSVDIPQEWMRLNTDKYLLMTKDGPFLQYVLVQERPVDRPFKHTRKKFNKGMLPLEAAEVIVDEISSDQFVLNFQVIENIPASINGHDGFQIVFTYKNKDGLKLKTIYYGFIVGEWFYAIRYTAANRHYFAKDLETFEKILNSFRLLKSQPA